MKLHVATRMQDCKFQWLSQQVCLSYIWPPSHSPSHSPSFPRIIKRFHMAEGAYAEGAYADPGDHSETTLHNHNYRGGSFERAETGTKSKIRSIRTPRSPPISASEIRAPQLSIHNQEISQLKLILKECVSMFSQKELERKKSDRTKKLLLLTIMILTNLLSVITTNYITHLFSAQCPENNLIPHSTLQYHPTLPTARFEKWNTEGTPHRDQWLENTEGTTHRDQWLENTEGTSPDIEAQITINVNTESPKQVNINNKTYGSIWVD